MFPGKENLICDRAYSFKAEPPCNQLFSGVKMSSPTLPRLSITSWRRCRADQTRKRRESSNKTTHVRHTTRSFVGYAAWMFFPPRLNTCTSVVPSQSSISQYFYLLGIFSIEKYSDCWKGRKEKCETTSCRLVV